MVSPRDYLEAQLKPLLPRTWKIVPVQRNLDALSRVTVMLKQQKISKEPSAPLSHHLLDFIVTVICPNTDVATAEVKLDDQVDDLIFAIDATKNVRWTDATKVVFGNAEYPAYDITVQVLSQKKEESK